MEPEQSALLTGGELADSEVTGGSDTGVVLPTPLRTHWYPWLARRITRATLPTSMVARRRHAVVDLSSPMMACPSERGYNTSRS